MGHTFYVNKDGKKAGVYSGKYPSETPFPQRFPFLTINSDGSNPKSLEFLSLCTGECEDIANIESFSEQLIE